ncbi:CAP domain-containing protein [Albidovulum sp.]|uniref:CAP domain-containing protein n=1 Tax=Albidovulum sp. TaxID=1872424 RepID=UPI001D2A0E0E|nr:CAP domain-containing protein [Paracoccaceae bacterium]HPE26162.1 CAP domain-containing protein [Albidovulum sp.]MCB2122621.1 CAP domain-containing protein [Paracoccaceae bacterium]MCB2159529.1 CAP domain-containing protein [Paracoccaceae bacterium]MCO5127925.1 CAP domain-containing protein [Paracoccaceae bacterium]
MHRLLIALFFMTALPGAATAAQCAIPSGGEAELQAVLQAVNANRKARGRGPLTRDATIDAAARGHACDMAAKSHLTHDGNGGPKRRIKKAGCKARLTGEAIAMGQRNAPEVVKAWMDSPPHKAILLLSKAKRVGLAVARDDTSGRLYWVFDVANGC